MFPVDRADWIPGSRRIRIARPDLDGHYEIATLPPGEYWVAANHMADRDVRSTSAALESLLPSARVTVRMGGIVRQAIVLR